MQKLPCSRFDKFNHVKYTKTLSVRNPHTVKTPYWTISRRPARAGVLDQDQSKRRCLSRPPAESANARDEMKNVGVPNFLLPHHV
jgi:hypothetical protein